MTSLQAIAVTNATLFSDNCLVRVHMKNFQILLGIPGVINMSVHGFPAWAGMKEECGNY